MDKKGIRNKRSIIHTLLFIYWFLQMLLLFSGFTSKGETLDTLIKVAILGTLCIYVFLKVYREQMKIGSLSFIIWCLYILSQLFTIIININKSPLNISSIISRVLFPIISIFIFIILLKREKIDKQDLIKFLNLFVGVVVFMCLYNLYINFYSIINILNVRLAYGNEMRSFLDSNHVFGFYIYIGMISCITLLNVNPKYKNWYIIFIFLLLGNLVTTFSRTSTISLIICILLIAIQNVNKKGYRTLLMFLIGIVILFSIQPIEDYVIKVFFKADSGLSHRDEIYSLGWNIFRNGNLLFGNGYDYPIEVLRSSLDRGGFHNTYISLLAFGGIVMFSFYVYLIIFALKNAVKIKKFDRYMGSIFISLILSILSYSLAENLIFFFSNATYFIASCFCVMLPLYYLNSLKDYKRNFKLDNTVLYRSTD